MLLTSKLVPVVDTEEIEKSASSKKVKNLTPNKNLQIKCITGYRLIDMEILALVC